MVLTGALALLPAIALLLPLLVLLPLLGGTANSCRQPPPGAAAAAVAVAARGDKQPAAALHLSNMLATTGANASAADSSRTMPTRLPLLLLVLLVPAA